MGENNLYIHNVDLVDLVDLDPQFYFSSDRIENSKKNRPILDLGGTLFPKPRTR